MTDMLGSVGDLVEDVVVHLLEPVHVASDTRSVVTRRRGGSAANMVEAACTAGGRARFIGQVGNDATGRWLTEQLEAVGADVAVRWIGRSGTIVVLVDPGGERTMLADRGACTELEDPDPAWLDGLHTLHVPYYSLVGEPLAATTTTLAGWAHDRGIRVSVDTSSAALLEHDGAAHAVTRMAALRPHVVFANELEAAVLGEALSPGALGGAMVIVKHGAGPASLHRERSGTIEVPAIRVEGVRDTTGAGDAFAAGFLLALADGADPVDAIRHAHQVAAKSLRT
jgi:sugar/nucleoside kinase (ribokinase family)